MGQKKPRGSLGLAFPVPAMGVMSTPRSEGSLCGRRESIWGSCWAEPRMWQGPAHHTSPASLARFPWGWAWLGVQDSLAMPHGCVSLGSDSGSRSPVCQMRRTCITQSGSSGQCTAWTSGSTVPRTMPPTARCPSPLPVPGHEAQVSACHVTRI